MDYKNALSQLRKAKAAHIKWRSYAYGLISGLDVLAEHNPIEHTECSFGLWYYDDKTQKTFRSLDSFSGIEVPHKVLHQIYHQIYELVAKKKMKQAEKQLDKLNALSKQLLEAVELVESELKTKINE